MAADKSARPRAGLGLSSAIGRDQMTTRKAATPKPAKSAAVKSRSGARVPPKTERKR